MSITYVNRDITSGDLSSAVFLNTAFLIRWRSYHREPPEKSWTQALMKGILVKPDIEHNIINWLGLNHRWVSFFFIVFGVVCLWSVVKMFNK